MKYRQLVYISLLFLLSCGSNKFTSKTITEPIITKKSISFTIIPKTNQLYSRDKDNKSEVIISGVTEGDIDSISVKLIDKSTNYLQNIRQKVNSKHFHLTFNIEAGLKEYLIEIYMVSSGKKELVKQIDNIVCGDVYVVHGQSNAWSIDYDQHFEQLPLESKWVRTIGSMHVYKKAGNEIFAKDDSWYKAKGTAPYMKNGEFYGNSMVGVLGMSIGLNLVSALNVPITIINGAGGGGAINHYLKTSKNDLNSTYGRLQFRIDKTGIKNNIKGFIWNQGESNGGSSILEYKKQLETLYTQFSNDFNFEKFYIIQTPPGCSSLGNHTGVREAQRRFWLENKHKVSIMTRHGFLLDKKNNSYFLNDNCHYHAEGYLQLGNWTSDLILNELYGAKNNSTIPNIVSAKATTDNTIILTFDSNISFEESFIFNSKTHYLKDYFSIETNDIISINKIERVLNNNKQLKLTTSDTIPANSNLIYLSKESYTGTNTAYLGPWVRSNASQIGALGFTISIQ